MWNHDQYQTWKWCTFTLKTLFLNSLVRWSKGKQETVRINTCHIKIGLKILVHTIDSDHFSFYKVIMQDFFQLFTKMFVFKILLFFTNVEKSNSWDWIFIFNILVTPHLITFLSLSFFLNGMFIIWLEELYNFLLLQALMFKILINIYNSKIFYYYKLFYICNLLITDSYLGHTQL